MCSSQQPWPNKRGEIPALNFLKSPKIKKWISWMKTSKKIPQRYWLAKKRVILTVSYRVQNSVLKTDIPWLLITTSLCYASTSSECCLMSSVWKPSCLQIFFYENLHFDENLIPKHFHQIERTESRIFLLYRFS